jgi:Spy/CpxP family protein refolding chaperone
MILAAGVMLAGMTSLALAQGPERGEGRRERASSGPSGERPRPLERLLKDLNLTEDQQKQVRQIMDTQRQAMENWRKENQAALKDLQKQLEDAKESGDKDKIKTARQEIEKIEQSRKALHENLIKQLKDVLTPDQLEKARKFLEQGREQFREEHPALRMLEGLKALDLTEEQKTQARAILDQARKKTDAATDPKEKEAAMKAAREKIESDVLTEPQRRKVRRLEGANALLKAIQRLNLTDDQKKQIHAIMEDSKAQAEKAQTDREKMDIHRQAFKKVHDTVLTDQQRQELKDMQKNQREGRVRPGERGPGNGPRSTSRPNKDRSRPEPDSRENDEDDFE